MGGICTKISIQDRSITLLLGDALRLMGGMGEAQFGAVITDPPYASGGATLSAKQQSTALKYTATKRDCPLPDFEGDSMDQRSWTNWMADVLREARRLSMTGAPLCVFSDWRQLPALSDAIQRAGWCWRGVVVWDKVNSRPQRGRFRQQAEFIVWASNGAMPVDRGVGVLPGVLSYTQPQGPDKRHQAQKPLDMMRQVVRICEPGGAVFDPFAGSGTTLLAAVLEGHDAFGCEVSRVIHRMAAERLSEQTNQD